MSRESDVEITDGGVGENHVRLLHVSRAGTWHQATEVIVETALTFDTENAYVSGDNSCVITSDSQKNIVYVLAKKHGISTIEKFAQRLAEHFLGTYKQVQAATVRIEEKSWDRIQQGEYPHAHAFLHRGDATRLCTVNHVRGGSPKITAGLKHLEVMKTTKSALKNFVKDEYTTLADTDDRVFGTTVVAEWRYQDVKGLNYDKAWSTVLKSILEVFAGPPTTGTLSTSPQSMIYDIGRKALSKVPQICDIHIKLPGLQSYEFDFSKIPAFGTGRNQQVFQPVTEPSGNIEVTLRRKGASKL